jgi:hypothetical protein
MKLITTLLIATCSMVSTVSTAQGTIDPRGDTIQWNYANVENRVKSELVNQGGYFINYGGQSFLWVQNGVDRKYVFKTQSVQGDWRDANKNGELVYRVNCNGEEGTLKLVRTRTQIFVELDFVQPNKTTPHLILLVTSINKI